ncbi:MAG: cofactor-independent phosphoglycerate mutase [Bacteroidales bacterium]|nr:cofactor-independent phosphoglycerate mutase [Bacteroidales bacterium]
MKYIIILADGAADEPIASLGDITPLQAAYKPNIDRIAREGINGRLVTVPEGFHPGSEIAHLGLFGYDVAKVFEGRGSLEAASMQIDIEDDEVAMRCNVICLDGEKIKNHSAGNISNEEAEELILFLNKEMGGSYIDASGKPVIAPAAALDDKGIPTKAANGEPAVVRFYPGVSYRHLLKIRGGNKNVSCTPPHDEIGKAWCNFMPHPENKDNGKKTKYSAVETSALIAALMLKSMEILSLHPVNQKRAAEGKDMANSIWPWSLGYRPSMQPLTKLFPDKVKSGAVISAVDLIFGIGVYCGLKKVEVPGATGLWDTNFEGKRDAALKELREKDFVFLHVEATDEAGHDGEPELKKQCIEWLDARCVGPILNEVAQWDETVRVAILPDHPTPIKYRTHTNVPVPFAIWQNKQDKESGWNADSVEKFDEDSCFNGSLGLLVKDQFIKKLLE